MIIHTAWLLIKSYGHFLEHILLGAFVRVSDLDPLCMLICQEQDEERDFVHASVLPRN